MNGDAVPMLSPVEKRALESSSFESIYSPTEKMPTIVVGNFPALGKLAAMRFIEWAQQNPGGVISLPTGKTPEHFIKWVAKTMRSWDLPETRTDLEKNGIDPGRKPDLSSLRFVQIDEFYPINPWQHNSFFFYVNQFYLSGFGLDPRKAMLIDCSRIGLGRGESLQTLWPDGEVDLSLRHRHGTSDIERRQKVALEAIDQWCQDYEERIREMGGIGFFLGGIGPEGHIGFNVRGSDHHSTTRLTPTNYETQAAASTDLGGMEVARKRLVITIGLRTITRNPDCTAIIIAAGEAKAAVVADAVQREPHVLYPATALHALPNARLYVTRGAARLLTERQAVVVKRAECLGDEDVDRIVINLAAARKKRLVDLSEDDFAGDPRASLLLAKRPEGAAELCRLARERMITKVQRGCESVTNTRFLHTEPHHDDIMLGYLPAVVRHGRNVSNTHFFACLTGGFTSVTNRFMKDQLSKLRQFIDTPEFTARLSEGYFNPRNDTGRNRDVWQYLDGVAADRAVAKDEGTARRLLRNLIEVFDEYSLENIRHRIAELEHYFDTQYSGKKDPEHIQRLKAMNREWEAECLWGYFGWNCSNVRHLRLGFYKGDIFTEEPTIERDVAPALRLLEEVKPDVVTVALDPEASGPDTHYKVLQVLAEALRQYEAKTGRTDIRVWGYRNVWFRFHPSEATTFVPVSMNMFSILRSAFMNTFNSQKDASFPSHEHDGPFCELSQRIQVDQYQMIKSCLGREWFHEHPSALMRATRGLVFLRDLSLSEFYKHTRDLRAVTE
jgi:glucosamine-6-phosphate deaminase